MTGKTRRIILWCLVLGLLAAGLTFAFWPRPIAVDLAVVLRGPLMVTIDEEGETRVRDIYVVSAPVAGRALRIEAEVGDQVLAGNSIVAQVEPADPAFLDVRSESEAQAAAQAAEAAEALARSVLDEAAAELEFAEAEFNRAEQLIGRGTVSQRTLDDARRTFKTRSAAVDTASAALRMRSFELVQARARLVSPVETLNRHGNCDCVPIAAPVSGRILRILHESEGVVAAGDPLLEIGNPSELEIVTDLHSSDAVKVEKGDRVLIEDWGGDDTLGGQVRRIEPYGFTKVSALGIEEQRVNVTIDFTDPVDRWRRLGHGYRVEARIVIWQAEDVVKAPLIALFRDGGEWSVFVDRNGRAVLRPVEVGWHNGVEAEITAGLEPGDWVILHPSEQIVQGVRIGAR